MGTSSRPQAHRSVQLPLRLASFANLGVALLQLLLFVPRIVEGNALDAPYLLAYRVDSLSVTFGVAWTLALALAAALLATVEADWANARRDRRWVAWSICLMSLGLLDVAYSRDLLTLYLGCEVAGLALWL